MEDSPQLHVRIPADLRLSLKAVADELQISLAQLVNICLLSASGDLDTPPAERQTDAFQTERRRTLRRAVSIYYANLVDQPPGASD